MLTNNGTTLYCVIPEELIMIGTITGGGISGSPVVNVKGKLVAVVNTVGVIYTGAVDVIHLKTLVNNYLQDKK